MIKVKAIMNSSVEDVIGFKCCNLPDLNLEIQVKNLSAAPVKVPSRFILEGNADKMDLRTVYPPNGQTVQPGEPAAFYCTMDEEEWNTFTSITAFDAQGRPYKQEL